MIWAGGQDHEIGLWNMNNFNCDLLLKVNQVVGKQTKPFMTEIPYIYKDSTFEENEMETLELLAKTMNQYRTRAYYIDTINSEFYSLSTKRFSKITNLFENSSTVQTALSPIITRFNDTNYENSPYILTAGNDNTIRYWDLTKESMVKKSYVLNAPSNLSYANYNSCCFSDTTVLQANEIYSQAPVTNTRKDSNFSEYQLYNGICFQNNLTSVTHDDEENGSFLKYVTKIAEASHKSVITDIQMIPVGNTNLLISSSWDGTVKIWK
jgi:WD40 repeat protein